MVAGEDKEVAELDRLFKLDLNKPIPVTMEDISERKKVKKSVKIQPKPEEPVTDHLKQINKRRFWVSNNTKQKDSHVKIHKSFTPILALKIMLGVCVSVLGALISFYLLGWLI